MTIDNSKLKVGARFSRPISIIDLALFDLFFIIKNNLTIQQCNNVLNIKSLKNLLKTCLPTRLPDGQAGGLEIGSIGN
jgi:hypothetical protein